MDRCSRCHDTTVIMLKTALNTLQPTNIISLLQPHLKYVYRLFLRIKSFCFQLTMATKWGCAGPGKISSDFFLAITSNLSDKDHKLVAVASRDISRAQDFADKFKFQRAYGSYADLATDKDIDIIYIGTTHKNHVELSIKYMEAGKHVLCEKPMALNYRMAKTVLERAKTCKRLFMEGVWSRWFPAYDVVRKELTAGTLGEIKVVQVNFCKALGKNKTMVDISQGGSALHDLGIYIIQFACMVFQEMPSTIKAVGKLNENGLDEYTVVVLQYKDGGVATLITHAGTAEGNNTAQIIGTKGRIDVEAPFHCPTKVTTPSGSHEFPLKNGEYNYQNSAGFQYEAEVARQCIIKGDIQAKFYEHWEIELVHQILDEVRKQTGLRYEEDN